MKKIILSDHAKGFIIGFLIPAIIMLIICVFIYVNNRKKEELKNALEYVEKQMEIEALREDYSSRSADDFLEIPDVRRAADGASDDFIRKRDEILQRFRDRIAN